MKPLLILTVCLLLVVGCKAGESKDGGSKAEAPVDVRLSAVKAVEDLSRRNKITTDKIGIPGNGTGSAALTLADGANGITEKWCVMTSYVVREGSGPWKDRYTGVLVVRYKNRLESTILPWWASSQVDTAREILDGCLANNILR